jgi:hypothetical protein
MQGCIARYLCVRGGIKQQYQGDDKTGYSVSYFHVPIVKVRGWSFKLKPADYYNYPSVFKLNRDPAVCLRQPERTGHPANIQISPVPCGQSG